MAGQYNLAFSERNLGATVDRFYEAACNPALWPEVLHEASLAMGAEGALLISHPVAGDGLVHSEGVGELLTEFVREGWVNVRAARGIQRDRWRLHSEATIATADELDRIPFYSDFLSRLGFRWFVRTTLAASGGQTTLISIERRGGADPFSPREIAAVEKALPHYRASSRLALHLGIARGEGMLAAFERMSHGAMLLNRAGRPICLNRRMEDLLGGVVSIVAGRPAARDATANALLERAIGVALSRPADRAETEASPIRLPREDGGIVMAYCVPLSSGIGDIFGRGHAILIVVDPDRTPPPDVDVLRCAFGLTTGEARLAALVAAGRSPQEAARSLGITVETARTILKRIFDKSGARSQSQLAAKIAAILLQ